MKHRFPIAPFMLEHKLQNHIERFNEFEQKFLINMLIMCQHGDTLTDKQYTYLNVLTRRLDAYDSIYKKET